MVLLGVCNVRNALGIPSASGCIKYPDRAGVSDSRYVADVLNVPDISDDLNTSNIRSVRNIPDPLDVQ